MSARFTDQAQKALDLANEEAIGLRHHYVGTEHLLLALTQAGTGTGADVLKSFGVEADNVRLEIEKLISRGTDAVTTGQQPLTPRAKRVIEYAREEARIVNQKLIDAEHLLLGLFREPDGVAARVLLNLGLSLRQVREEALRVRLLQMKIVERAVRPVRATSGRKRKMREELLAHLTAIYEEEQARWNDPAKAMHEAAARFGDPAELAGELQDALPFTERLGYTTERFFGWRAPESAARYMMRVAVRLFFLLLLLFCPIVGVVAVVAGLDISAWKALRPLAALLLFLPVSQFLLGILYFKMRDALCGAFGAPRSLSKTFEVALGMASVVFGLALGFIAVTAWDRLGEAPVLQTSCAAAFLAPLFLLLQARVHGPTEISDTVWECLDLKTATN
jgi:hypothetical protein